jgi:hypothetical protein
VKQFQRWFVALLVTSAMSTASLSSAQAVDWTCPSKTDVPYVVGEESTLSAIAEKAYCESTEPKLSFAWTAIQEYNKAILGKDNRIYSGLILCLPEHLVALGSYLNRCLPASPTVENPQKVDVAACGNGKREIGELCDGADLGGMTCASVNLGEGKPICRADCQSFDTAVCSGLEVVPYKPPQPGSKVEKPRVKPLPRFRGVAADAAMGAVIPLLGDTWKHLHQALGQVKLGARVDLYWFQLAPRVHFLVGRHGTFFNDVATDQTVLGGGASIDWGVPLRAGKMRITPGVSTGVTYLNRSFQRHDFAGEGKLEAQNGVVPTMGLFVRPELRLPKYPKWNVQVDIGGEVMLYALSGAGTQANVNAKVAGGVGYAF